MRLTLAIMAVIASTSVSGGVLATTEGSDKNLRGRSLQGNSGNSNGRPMTKSCTLERVAKLQIPGESPTSEYEYECTVDAADSPNGQANMGVGINLSPSQKEQLDGMVEGGEVELGRTKLNTEGAVVSAGEIILPDVAVDSSGNNAGGGGRKLAIVTGVKPILVVKVTDSVGKARTESAAQISDDIFGTYGDPNNLKSQLFDCTWGQLNVTAGDPPINSAGSHEVAPGVIEVTISVTLEGNSRSTIRNAVTTAAQNKLGFSLPGPYQQVMYVLEGCYQDCGWAAYAYINSWNSVYQGPYYYMTGVQVHELGHNFNLAHSGGLDSQTYTDHTCLMGNPLYSDDVGKMCFNPAKNYQLGWYSNDVEDHAPVVNVEKMYSLIGIGEWNNGVHGKKVVIKLPSPNTSKDYYVGFNRAAGPNAQNDEADNEVTIIERNQGTGYSQSFLKQHLVQGESYTFTNWNNSGQNLVIKAETIDITTSPGTADVTFCLGSCGPATPAPTSPPTPLPPPTTALPTATPTTAPPTTSPTTASPTTATPTSPPTLPPTSAPTFEPVYFCVKGSEGGSACDPQNSLTSCSGLSDNSCTKGRSCQAFSCGPAPPTPVPAPTPMPAPTTVACGERNQVCCQPGNTCNGNLTCRGNGTCK